MGKRLELTGQKFGRLTVIRPLPASKHWASPWLCECDCGNYITVREADLKSGGTKNCGCKYKFPKGVAARNAVLCYHKINAKRRNLEQALTDEQIIVIHKKNCHYCGALPSNIKFSPRYNGSYTYSGLDRIDNNKGYTIDNVVSCCAICNRAKSKLSYDEFISWLNRVQSYLNETAH